MEWGSVERELRSVAEETGVPVQAIKNKPILPKRLSQYMEAFLDLSGSRPQVMFGVGRIPISELKYYLDLIGIEDDDDKRVYLKFIQAFDEVYIENALKKTEKK